MQPPGKLWMPLVGGDETCAALVELWNILLVGDSVCVGDLKALKEMKNLNG